MNLLIFLDASFLLIIEVCLLPVCLVYLQWGNSNQKRPNPFPDGGNRQGKWQLESEPRKKSFFEILFAARRGNMVGFPGPPDQHS